jgi:hypothetical protein
MVEPFSYVLMVRLGNGRNRPAPARRPVSHPGLVHYRVQISGLTGVVGSTVFVPSSGAFARFSASSFAISPRSFVPSLVSLARLPVFALAAVRAPCLAS